MPDLSSNFTPRPFPFPTDPHNPQSSTAFLQQIDRENQLRKNLISLLLPSHQSLPSLDPEISRLFMENRTTISRIRFIDRNVYEESICLQTANHDIADLIFWMSNPSNLNDSGPLFRIVKSELTQHSIWHFHLAPPAPTTSATPTNQNPTPGPTPDPTPNGS